MRIFLIGMMGAGKTTIGQQLAEQLKIPFIDIDAYIEKQENSTVALLFEQEGQERFREIERQALKAVVNEFEDAVIATGGGTPCFFNNMDFMNRHGKSIYLNVSQKEIFERLRTTDLASRPLLAGKSETELKEFIAKTLDQRHEFYAQATYTLVNSEGTIGEILTLLNHK